MSILVIEDDINVRRAVGMILEEEGFIVTAFADADVALTHLSTHPVPSLIILDLDLPVIDGAAFRARQLCDPRLSLVPVIVISGREGGAEEARRLEATDFVAKPFAPEELLHVVQNRAVTLTRSEHFLRGALRFHTRGDP